MIAALPVAVAFRKHRFDDAIIPDSIVYMIDRRQARCQYFREINS